MSKIVEQDNWNYFEAPPRPYGSTSATENHRSELPIAGDDDSLPPPYDGEIFDQVDVNTLEKPTCANTVPQPRSSSCAAKQEKATGIVKLDEPIEIRGENKFERAIRLYGNPLAQDANWSVTEDDYYLTKLPKVDLSVKMTNSFKTIIGPAKQDRPGFLRDPKQNRLFNPNSAFHSYLIPNKLRCSEFVGTGFSSVFNGSVMASHDVSAADWRQFLDDIAAAGSTAMGSIPLGLNISKTGIPLTRAVGKFLQWTREENAQEVLRIWQRRFFRPRGLDVAVDVSSLEDEMLASMQSMNANFQSDECSSRRDRKQARKDLKDQLKTLHRDYKRSSKTHGRVRLLVSPLNRNL